MSLSERDVLAALAQVIDPELNLDLVRAGMIKNLRIEGASATLQVELTTPACPLKGKIEQDLEAALRAVVGLESFKVDWTAQVRAATPSGGPRLLPRVKNVVLVGAGKGGVGKSTVAVNLAAALSKCGATVGLLDADVYGPSIPMMTGIRRRPSSRDGQILEPLEAHGMRVMSIGFLVPPEQALVWRGPRLHGAILQLVRDVRWGALDYLVLDLPPGTGDVALTLAQQVQAAGAVLVTTPQDVSLADVIRAKKMFDDVHVPVLGIVENMSTFICPHCHQSTDVFDKGGGRRAAEAMGIPLLGEIPLELRIRQGCDRGVPAVLGDPHSPEALSFMAMARTIAGRISQENLRIRPPVIQAQASGT